MDGLVVISLILLFFTLFTVSKCLRPRLIAQYGLDNLPPHDVFVSFKSLVNCLITYNSVSLMVGLLAPCTKPQTMSDVRWMHHPPNHV